ncbi:MAG: hypothetical protein AB9903_12495 [Vulcanimicrobiota bacterium]
MSKEITIIYRHDPECWWAVSPDIERYRAAREKLEDLREMIHTELPDFLGEELVITEILGTYKKTA